MSLVAKLRDLTKGIPQGEAWCCFQVPEEFRIWTLANKWKAQAFEDYGVQPIRMRVRGVSEATSQKQRFPAKLPLKLPSGIEITGERTKTSSTTLNYVIRADSTREMNDVFSEISRLPSYEADNFIVRELQVYNPSKGVLLDAVIHNPDGNGPLLYIVQYHKDNQSKLYPTLLLKTQQEYVGKFFNAMASCTNDFELIPHCGIKKRAKQRGTKLNKSSK